MSTSTHIVLEREPRGACRDYWLFYAPAHKIWYGVHKSIREGSYATYPSRAALRAAIHATYEPPRR